MKKNRYNNKMSLLDAMERIARRRHAGDCPRLNRTQTNQTTGGGFDVDRAPELSGASLSGKTNEKTHGGLKSENIRH